MMEAQVIKELERLITENQKIEHDNQVFVPIGYKPLRWIDRPDPIHLSTLRSFVDFVDEVNRTTDNMLSNCAVLITDDLTVQLLSAPHVVDKKRTLLAEAKFDYKPYPFGRFLSSEEFAILLQTRFVITDNAKGLIAITRKLQIEDGVELTDDGMAQKVTIKKGISAASMANEVVPSFIKLAPYRIFPECDQIETIFLLRLSGNKEDGANVGLFEADGGIWKVHAKEVIRKKLQDLNINSDIPVYC